MIAERIDYSQMSPEELRGEAEELLSLVPTVSKPGGRDHLDREYMETMRQRLEGILEASHLTESLRALVVEDFSEGVRMGFDQPVLEVLADRSKNVFDEDLAKEGEKALLKYFQERAVAVEAGKARKMREEEANLPTTISEDLLPKARREFFEKYGEEA